MEVANKCLAVSGCYSSLQVRVIIWFLLVLIKEVKRHFRINKMSTIIQMNIFNYLPILLNIHHKDNQSTDPSNVSHIINLSSTKIR